MSTNATRPSPMPPDPGASRPADPVGHRRTPDMQVVTKGWLSLKLERQPVETLEKADRDERSRV